MPDILYVFISGTLSLSFISQSKIIVISQAKMGETNLSQAGFNPRLRYTLREDAHGLAEGDR